MTRAFLLALIVVAVAAAQNQPSNPARVPGKSAISAPSADLTVRGCVSGGERYTLMQVSTGAMFALVGNPNRFARLRGKMAEVRGSELPPDQQAASGELPKLEVTDIKLIGNKCPVQAQPEKASTTSIPPVTANQHQQTAPPVSTPRYQSPGAPNETSPHDMSGPNMNGATGAPSPGNGSPAAQPPPHL